MAMPSANWIIDKSPWDLTHIKWNLCWEYLYGLVCQVLGDTIKMVWLIPSWSVGLMLDDLCGLLGQVKKVALDLNINGDYY